jgi:energy-coupling factor transporter ATP-binding protein EcfA2
MDDIMRIARVRIKNFRCLEDVTVEFDDVTTLIGPNGVGKSTVLHALDWFFNDSKTGVLVDDDVTYGSETTQIEVQVEFHKLTLDDRDALGKYASPGVDRCVITKYRRADGQEVMSGNAKGYEAFAQIRAAVGRERKDLFNQLVTSRPDLKLTRATTIPAAEEAMRAWEIAHLDLLRLFKRWRPASERDEDRLQWDIDGEEWADDFFNPESTHRLKVFLEVRPCSQSSGVEGDFDDIDDEATPDNEVPQELIDKLREARELAKKYSGDITDGTWASEYNAEADDMA